MIGARSTDDTRKALVRSWLTKAASDLRGARILGAADEPPLDAAIYNCQQTAEKAVKAFLVSKELFPEKTHDIRELTLAAVGHEPRLNKLLDVATSLTPHAWDFRRVRDEALERGLRVEKSAEREKDCRYSLTLRAKLESLRLSRRKLPTTPTTDE